MKKSNHSLTEGNPVKLILLFAIPIFLGNLFQIFYSLIDTKIVGMILGENALAAVGSVSILYNLLVGFFNGLTLGFSVITARYFGSQDFKAMKKNVAGTIVLGGGTATFIVMFTMLFLQKILQFMNIPEAQFTMAKSYIGILITGMFITLAYNTCANLLRAIGDSFTPLLFLMFAAGLNIVLDLLCIQVFHMGVMGAAVATVVAQLVSVILCMIHIVRKVPVLHIKKNDFNLEAAKVIEMFKSGLSMGLMSCLVSFGTLILQSSINTLGTDIIVAHTAARKVFEIWGLPVSTFGAAMATFSGQNYGAKKYERIRRGMRSVLCIGWCWSALVLLMAYTVAPFLIRFITSSDQPDIIYWGTMYLKVDMCFHVVCTAISILRNTMQGFGDYITPIVSSGIELAGKVVFALVFVKYFGYWAIIWTEPIIWILMVIPLIVMTVRNPVMRKQ